MDRELRRNLETFLKPLYQDLDGATRLDDVERIAKIAYRLHPAPDDRALALLLHFHPLGRWLEKLGNLSRAALALGGVSAQELRQTAQSIRRLDEPVTQAERAVAAAILIDRSGVRGLTEQIARARREGNSLMDVLRAALSDVVVPAWLPAGAETWLHARRESRREVCRRLLDELSPGDWPEERR
jgi:hypothetical protein